MISTTVAHNLFSSMAQWVYSSGACSLVGGGGGFPITCMCARTPFLLLFQLRPGGKLSRQRALGRESPVQSRAVECMHLHVCSPF